MKTWLQWVSKGPVLSVPLVPRLWPSPPRTMGDYLRVPMSSAIIMIIILSRGLMQLARANLPQAKVLASQSLYWTLLLTEGVVSKQPPPYPTSLDPQAWSTHPLLGQPLGYPTVPTKTASSLLFWTPDWPGAGLSPTFERSMRKLVAPSLWLHMFYSNLIIDPLPCLK